MDTIKDIRIAHFVEKKGIREISRDFNLSRNTVRTVLRSGMVDQSYCRIDTPTHVAGWGGRSDDLDAATRKPPS